MPLTLNKTYSFQFANTRCGGLKTTSNEDTDHLDNYTTYTSYNIKLFLFSQLSYCHTILELFMDWNGLRNITSIWTLTELNYVFNRLIGSCAKLDRFCSVWLCYRLVFKHYTYIGAYSFSPLVLTSISDTDVDGVWTTDSVVLKCEACKTTCIHDQASKSLRISWFLVTDHNYLFSSSLWQRIDNRHVDDIPWYAWFTWNRAILYTVRPKNLRKAIHEHFKLRMAYRYTWALKYASKNKYLWFIFRGPCDFELSRDTNVHHTFPLVR